MQVVSSTGTTTLTAAITTTGATTIAVAASQNLAAGVVINGLAIINTGGESLYGGGFSGHTQPTGGLPNWYHDNVTGGPGSFLLVVNDFEDFGDAMTKKLLNEIAGTKPANGLALLR